MKCKEGKERVTLRMCVVLGLFFVAIIWPSSLPLSVFVFLFLDRDYAVWCLHSAIHGDKSLVGNAKKMWLGNWSQWTPWNSNRWNSKPSTIWKKNSEKKIPSPLHNASFKDLHNPTESVKNKEIWIKRGRLQHVDFAHTHVWTEEGGIFFKEYKCWFHKNWRQPPLRAARSWRCWRQPERSQPMKYSGKRNGREESPDTSGAIPVSLRRLLCVRPEVEGVGDDQKEVIVHTEELPIRGTCRLENKSGHLIWKNFYTNPICFLPFPFLPRNKVAQFFSAIFFFFFFFWLQGWS